MREIDTWLDGGGVLADRPLGGGTRIRFRPDPERPALDLTARVERGVLVIGGPWSKVTVVRVALNLVELRGWL